jgi:hypothetical protein
MGISDTDRLDFFATPRRGTELANWMAAVQTRPDEAGVPSRLRDTPLRDAEDAMLAALEHKGHIWWNQAQRCFVAITVSVQALVGQFPSFRVCPGQSSELLRDDLDMPHFGRDASPGEHRAVVFAIDRDQFSRLAA